MMDGGVVLVRVGGRFWMGFGRGFGLFWWLEVLSMFCCGVDRQWMEVEECDGIVCWRVEVGFMVEVLCVMFGDFRVLKYGRSF